MQKIISVLIFTLCLSYLSHAQDWKKIEALKVGYITQELDMSAEKAQSFWPIYTKYERTKWRLNQREKIDFDNIPKLSEAKAEEMLKELLTVEKEEYLIKKELFTELKKILSAQEIIKLHQLEEDFNKKLLKEYRKRKEDNNK